MLPGLAIDESLGPEPLRLSEFHYNAKARGYEYFIPKSKEEMDMIFSRKDHTLFGEKFIGRFWLGMGHTVEIELCRRYEDGVQVFVDSYLGYMDTFFSFVNDPIYNEIVESLFKNPHRCEGHFGIMDNLWDTVIAMNRLATDNQERRNLLTYIVLRIDHILKKHNILEKTGRCSFFPSYKTLMLDENYRESPLYLAIEEEILRALSQGITISFDKQE
jgi:hypothetical protein